MYSLGAPFFCRILFAIAFPTNPDAANNKTGITSIINNLYISAEYIDAFKSLRDNQEHYQDIVRNCNAANNKTGITSIINNLYISDTCISGRDIPQNKYETFQ